MAGKKISQLPGLSPALTDIVAAVQSGTTGQETLQDISDLFFANAGADFPVNTNITSMAGLTGYLQAPVGIKDSSGNAQLVFVPIASAVNSFQMQNNATGSAPVLSSVGSDTNIALQLTSKGNLGVNARGTTAGDNAPSGYIGEFISSIISSGSPVTGIATLTDTNITSISLTAGDWVVYGNVNLTAIGTTVTAIFGWSSTVSATAPDISLYNGISDGNASYLQDTGIQIPTRRYSLSGTTTIYLSIRTAQVAGTNSACGAIYARRAR